MPFLEKGTHATEAGPRQPHGWNIFASHGLEATGKRSTRPLLPVCGNPACNASWMRLWRSRQIPVIEGRWSCSAACTDSLIRRALARELDGAGEQTPVHKHRVPLGLLLLNQGIINHSQLKNALEAQREAGSGRIGAWLIRREGLDERHVTKALSLQWNCPVFSLENQRAENLESIVPRLFVDTFGILPLRIVGSKILYIAFEDRIDHCVSLALERMTALRVEAGIISTSEFSRAHARVLEGSYPKTRLVECQNAETLAESATGIVESTNPIECRIARLHDFLWLRCWKHDDASLHQGSPPDRGCVEDTLYCLTARD